jgi:hypothetical protein
VLQAAVVTLDLFNFSINKTIPISQCENAGIVFGANNLLFVSCSVTQLTTYGFSASYIIDATTGTLHNVTGVNGVDRVVYSAKTNNLFESVYQYVENGVSSPFIAVVAQNGTVIQKVPTDNITAHAVAVDEVTGSFIVPVKVKEVLIYLLGENTTATTSGGVASATASVSNAETGSMVNLFVLGGVFIASIWFAKVL